MKTWILVIGGALLAAWFLMKNTKVVSPPSDVGNGMGLDPDLTKRSSDAAISTLLDWWRTHPQAMDAQSFGANLDISTNSRYVPPVDARSTSLTQIAPNPLPNYASILGYGD